MYRKYLILAMLIFVVITQLCFAESVTFKSSSKSVDGNALMLTGLLTKPEGSGPFPAIVLLHGAGGFQDSMTRSEAWSNRLVQWGYVTLMVDSFGPRGIEEVVSNSALLFSSVHDRALDAYDAKSYLVELPFVDKNRIAVLGWAHGGMAVLAGVLKLKLSFPVKDEEAFNAAIVFYPYCDELLTQTNAPLLILHGESDDWTPAASCSQFMDSKPKKHEVILKIYPGAYHCFDWEGKDETVRGHKLIYNQEAAKDAIVQVKSFLAKHLK